MTSMSQAIKGVGPKLVPFFKTLAIYFVVFIPHDQPSVLATILKCLPSIGLVIFIILQTKSAGTEYQFSKYIIMGMLFGCVGDACLIWPGFFDVGLISFLIGHLMYIRALGFESLNLIVGGLCYIITALGVSFFWSKLDSVLVWGVPIYSTVIMTMVWRTIDRLQFMENKWTWSKMCTFLGSICFAVSDFFVAFDRCYGSFAYDQLIIMSLYYAGQFGLAVSVLDAKPTVLQETQIRCEQKPIILTEQKKQGIIADEKNLCDNYKK